MVLGLGTGTGQSFACLLSWNPGCQGITAAAFGAMGWERARASQSSVTGAAERCCIGLVCKEEEVQGVFEVVLLLLGYALISSAAQTSIGEGCISCAMMQSRAWAAPCTCS